MAKGLRLVLFGPPGAGKGTQAHLLKDKLAICHISSGDLFRHNVQNETPLGLKAIGFMDQGDLVPDDVTIDIVLDKVLSLNAEDGFILDGFPRNPGQAQALQEALALRSRGLDRVIHIDVPESKLVERLAHRFTCRKCHAPYNAEHAESPECSGESSANAEPRCHNCGGELYQRSDDRPESVRRRIEVYCRETMPVLDFYREKGLLVDVPGSDAIESVNIRLLEALNWK